MKRNENGIIGQETGLNWIKGDSKAEKGIKPDERDSKA